MTNKITQDKFNQLRRQAEELIKSGGIGGEEFDIIKDPLKLIHELQTFQVELELQNEELMRSQEELMESRECYTELYDLAPVGYVTLSSKGLILNANLTFSDMVSVERSYLMNQPLSAYISFDDQDVFYRHLRELFSSKKRQACELIMEKKNGKPFYANIESTITSDESKKSETCLSVVMDISERITAEKEKEKLEAELQKAKKMESLGILTGGIAHDFNNILFIILGNAEAALESMPAALESMPADYPAHFNINEIKTALNEIKAAGLRAAKIVKQLLSFTRKTPCVLNPINIKEHIEKNIKSLSSSLPETIDIHQNLSLSKQIILAEPVQVEQVLMNLFTNASQAMEKTGGILKISAEDEFLTDESARKYSGISPGDYVKITISDTGEGIAPEITDRIFEPYFTTREFGKGSGLGLTVVHGIVKSLRGAVSFESRPGRGAVFSVLLPLAEKKTESENEKQDQIPAAHEKILFVDDEPSICSMAEKMLKRLGYGVEVRLDPIKALDLLRSKPDDFDLLITDMSMPEMTGIQLCKKIKEIPCDIPIIICTGDRALIDEEKAGNLGVAGYIPKPASMAETVEIIREILAQKNMS